MIEGLVDGLVTEGGKILDGIVSWVKSIWPAIKNWFVDIWNNFTNWVNGLWEGLKDLGKNIINGIWEGLKSAWESLTKWFTDAWNWLVGGIKDLLGIHSPSRVFAEIGKNMAAGVGIGFQKEFSGIRDDINSSMDFGGAIGTAELSVNNILKNVETIPQNSKGDSYNINVYTNAKTSAETANEIIAAQKRARWCASW